MEQIKHTPGPWKQKNGTLYGSDGFRICQSAFGRTPHESISNDSLIAAAPELLAELKKAVEAGESMGWKMESARAAIAKAEGA